MEIVLDHFIVEWLFQCKERMEKAFLILQFIKRKCHKMVFTPEHLRELERKLSTFEREYKNDFIVRRIIGLFRDMLSNSNVTNVRGKVQVDFIKNVPPDDHAIVESLMRVSSQSRILVTSDDTLIEIVNAQGAKFGMKSIHPDAALVLLDK